MNEYVLVLKKYAQFTGRSGRREFWMFVLISFLISFALNMAGLQMEGLRILGGIYSLAVLIPSLAVGARRLHDIGKSGWWLLLSFIPLVGAIVLVVFFATDSQPGSNQYGANPEGQSAPEPMTPAAPAAPSGTASY